MPISEKSKSLVQIHVAVLFFGLAGLFAKLLALSSPVIVWGRVFFATLTLLLILRFSGRGFKLNSGRDYFYLTICGFILAVHWIAFFQAIKVSTVAVGLLTYSTFPIFVTFIEPFFFKEKLRAIDIILALVTFLGVAFVIPKFELQNNVFVGAIWGILSGFTFAILSIINRKYVAKYSSLLIAFYQDGIAMLFLTPLLFFLKPAFHLQNILLLILLGVIFTAIAHSLFIRGMAYVKAQVASIIASLEPVYGIIFAIIILSEIPSLRVIVGGIIILAANYVSSLKAEPSPLPPE